MEIRTSNGGGESVSTQTIENWPDSNIVFKVLRNLKTLLLSTVIPGVRFFDPKAGAAMSKVEIKKSPSGSIEIVGELNHDNVMALAHDASGIFASERDLYIDLGGISHTDSAGIALLVEWLSEARHHNQEIHFINVPEQVMDVARVSNLDRVLPMSEAAVS